MYFIEKERGLAIYPINSAEVATTIMNTLYSVFSIIFPNVYSYIFCMTSNAKFIGRYNILNNLLHVNNVIFYILQIIL